MSRSRRRSSTISRTSTGRSHSHSRSMITASSSPNRRIPSLPGSSAWRGYALNRSLLLYVIVSMSAPSAGTRPGQVLVTVMLLAAAALDLTRCGLVVAAPRPQAPAPPLVAVGLAAAGLSAWTARGCRGSRRWSQCAALLIGVASAPQASASGFHGPYTVPDTATAILGVLLTVTILATAGN